MGQKQKNLQQVRQVAQELFGYESLRSGQEAAIQAILNGHDTLAVMPTGSGKSAIYQIAAFLIPGPTVVVSPLPTGEVIVGEQPADITEAAESALQAQERRQQFERSRLEMMRGYAEVRNCRREYLLNYFGKKLDEPCGLCDNCKAGITVEKEEGEQMFPLNSRVVHNSWGEGLVMRYEGDKIVILFDEVGYKTLAIDLVRQRGLLKQVG